MATTVTMIITRPAGAPFIRVSGDVGGYIEIKPQPAPGEEFFIAASDGTLLRGAIGEGLRLAMAGEAPLRIDGDAATLDATIGWVVVAPNWAAVTAADDQNPEGPPWPFDNEDEIVLGDEGELEALSR